MCRYAGREGKERKAGNFFLLFLVLEREASSAVREISGGVSCGHTKLDKLIGLLITRITVQR